MLNKNLIYTERLVFSMLVRPSVIILNNDEILMLKYNYSGNIVFALPGGNPDPSETLTDTLVRELKEELHLDIEPKGMVLAGEVIVGDKSTLHCIFKARILSGTPVLNPVHTSAIAVDWIKVSEAGTLNLYPNVGIYLNKLLTDNFTSRDLYVGRIKQNWF